MRSFCAVLGSSACPESIREEAALPTFLLTINDLGKSREKRKKSARDILSGKQSRVLWDWAIVKFLSSIRWFLYVRSSVQIVDKYLYSIHRH